MKDCDSCEDIFKNTQENPCDDCEYRKTVAKLSDIHWLGWRDCPVIGIKTCPFRIEGVNLHDRD